MEDLIYWQLDPARVAESLGSRGQHFLDGGERYALSILLALAADLVQEILLSRSKSLRHPIGRIAHVGAISQNTGVIVLV